MLSDVVPARLRVEQADLNLSFTVAPSRHVVVLTKMEAFAKKDQRFKKQMSKV